MPAPILNKWTIRKLLTNTYVHKRNRFENKERDVLKTVRVRKISEYDLSTRRKRTKYILETNSFPNYSPYYTKKDLRGRPRKYQRTYRHRYSVVIQLDRLSINVPVKLRTGSDRAWDFSERGRSKKLANGRIREGSNVLNGRNGDFFFRLEYLYAQEGILYGRNWTNGPPVKANKPLVRGASGSSRGIIFLDKHALRAIEILMNQGILKDD